MQIGFVGTGLMGTGMARCLMEAGHTLTVHDVWRNATADLCASGARWAETPKAVAEATEVVITSLPGPEEVEKVFFRQGTGIVEALRPGSCYIDTTTNSPALLRRIAGACKERDSDVLDCPVTGRAPDMTIMAGGDPRVLEKYKPMLLAMSREVYHMGDVGMGMVTKGVHQYLLHAKFLLLSEVLLIGVKGGLDVGALTDLLSHVGAGQGMPWDTFRNIVFPGHWDLAPGGPGPVFRWIKDVGVAGETARAFDIEMPILAVIEGVLARAQANGWGNNINFSDIRILEELAGTELRMQT